MGGKDASTALASCELLLSMQMALSVASAAPLREGRFGAFGTGFSERCALRGVFLCRRLSTWQSLRRLLRSLLFSRSLLVGTLSSIVLGYSPGSMFLQETVSRSQPNPMQEPWTRSFGLHSSLARHIQRPLQLSP